MSRTEIIVGAERERALRGVGFSAGLLELLSQPSSDPITSRVVASDGTVLVEIAGLPGVEGALPPGRVVPIRHVDESQLVYDLLVEANGGWSLVRWTPEATDAFDGGVDGYLTDLVVEAWELEVAPDDAIVAWAERIGHPAAARLVRELATNDRSTIQAHERWRQSFLRSLRSE